MEEQDDLTIQSSEELADSDVNKDKHSNVMYLSGLYENWFLDYASYVIMERAVPYIEDGLKPVHRRILHAMWEIDDGRYNKVANIIGNTMKYHPHGDASIGDALVQMGQKDLLIDMQGNWGNIYTGDRAAAPRYIEARLSKFALEVVFNPKTTKWKLSYDGRNDEPVTLPMKFPLLLAHGVEGIAVGLASKILPHNFNELIDASIDILRGKEISVFPDFPTGGMADFSRYNGGMRGGKVRVRAKISQNDKKSLVINEIPFGTTTTSLIESVLSANDKGKIKIKKIEDNTAENVEIMIHLQPGISPDITIDALYAFTDCEVSISPNCCIIQDGKPRFTDVNTVLKVSTYNTLELLKRELEIGKAELLEQLHFASLEKVFIEERIYNRIVDCETREAVFETIDKGLEPFKPQFIREVTHADLVRLTEIKIMRISRYDAFKAEEAMMRLNNSVAEIQNHLDNLIDFAVNYFKQIKKKYGKDKDRKTEIRAFDTIQATEVAVANAKLYVNREEGFAGMGLSKHEYLCDCSDIDDIIVFKDDGTCFVTKVSDKFYVGKNPLHIAVFRKNDESTIYNMIYRDGLAGSYMVKRFAITGVTRDKEYDLTKGERGSKVLYFTVNPKAEAELIRVFLKPKPKLKKLIFDFDFSTIAIKGRGSMGNILSRYPIHKVVLKQEGVAVLGAKFIWFDEATKRLNCDHVGKYLGEFKDGNKIITIMKSGNYRLVSYDLSNHFDDDLLMIEKYKPGKIYTAVYFDPSQKLYYIKRFEIEESDKKISYLGDEEGLELELITDDKYPQLELIFKKEGDKVRSNEVVNVHEFIAVKGLKAKGKRLTPFKLSKINLMDPIEVEEPELEEEENDLELPTPTNTEGADGEIKQITLEF